MSKREQLLGTAKQYTARTYSTKFVAPLFQRMIRAEFGARLMGFSPAVVDGELVGAYRDVGQVVCVTCGKVGPWAGGLGGMHTGHFLGSRTFSILYEEDNVAPQCSHCNRYLNGAQGAFRLWMEVVRGQERIDRLIRQKNETRKLTVEDLVDMRMVYAARLKVAKATMTGI